MSSQDGVAVLFFASAAAAVGFLADTWPVACVFHRGETRRCSAACNRPSEPTAPVSLKARVRHAFLSTRQSQRMKQLMSQHAMHAEQERVRKEKA